MESIIQAHSGFQKCKKSILYGGVNPPNFLEELIPVLHTYREREGVRPKLTNLLFSVEFAKPYAETLFKTTTALD